MVNEATLDLITKFEGFVDHWYADPAHGWSVPTCCYGHTDAAGEPKYAATKAKKFTKAEGRAILLRDLKKYEDAVRKYVKVPLNENQYGALVSFCFNVGPGNLQKSTLVKKLNAGDYASVPAELAKWNKSNRKVLAGLTRRREAEGVLFKTPVSGKAVSAPSPAPKQEGRPAAKPEAKRGFWAAIFDLIGKVLRGGK
jgi:lysozyme